LLGRLTVARCIMGNEQTGGVSADKELEVSRDCASAERGRLNAPWCSQIWEAIKGKYEDVKTQDPECAFDEIQKACRAPLSLP
jgi:hypothetical protein